VSRTAPSPRRLLVVAVLASALTLTGCASGKIAQTAQQVSAVSSGNGKIGEIDVLDVQFQTPTDPTAAYPKGGTAPLEIWVSNDSIKADTLTQVTTPAAAKVEMQSPATVQAQSLEDFGTKYKITLTGLTAPISYGVSVPVTFTFQAAGSITINVPVEIPGERTTGRPSIPLGEPDETSIYQSGSESASG
jgi:copper(I)-binding protein